MRPPYTSLTMGALSRRFKTIPILLREQCTVSFSYNIPTYRFLDNKHNGQNVFSYSSSCGNLRNMVAKCPASFANSIVNARASIPVIFSPSCINVNLKKTESVSPYTYSAVTQTGPIDVSHIRSLYTSSMITLA